MNSFSAFILLKIYVMKYKLFLDIFLSDSSTESSLIDPKFSLHV